MRVPTVVISPFVKKGTILRSQTSTPYDHTSIISSLRKRWSLGDALTGRDAVSPDLDAALSLSEPTNLGPERVEALPYNQSPGLLAGARAAPLNDLQKRLLDLSANLPPSALEEIGYKIAVYPLTLLNVSIAAMRNALRELLAGKPASAAMDFQQLKSAVGFPGYYEEEARYRG